jgi:hypothetical protein
MSVGRELVFAVLLHIIPKASLIAEARTIAFGTDT